MFSSHRQPRPSAFKMATIDCRLRSFSNGTVFIVSILLYVFVVFSVAQHDDEEVLTTERQTPVECTSDRHVCQTLMRLNNGEVMDEDPYCTCDACIPEWKTDTKSLTWVHYERRDYAVMYRFCTDLETVDKCVENSTAVHIETDIKGWNPRIKQFYCACSGIYHLAGWRKTAGTWRYNYRCEKHNCNKSGPCVKHFVNGHGKTTGYKFLCACEEGYHCNTDQKYEASAVETDDKGDRFIYDYCELNLGRRKRATKYTEHSSGTQ